MLKIFYRYSDQTQVSWQKLFVSLANYLLVGQEEYMWTIMNREI